MLRLKDQFRQQNLVFAFVDLLSPQQPSQDRIPGRILPEIYTSRRLQLGMLMSDRRETAGMAISTKRCNVQIFPKIVFEVSGKGASISERIIDSGWASKEIATQDTVLIRTLKTHRDLVDHTERKIAR